MSSAHAAPAQVHEDLFFTGSLAETDAELAAAIRDELLRQQAACLACSLAAKPEAWPTFRAQLGAAPDDPVEWVLRAIALGWDAKWT